MGRPFGTTSHSEIAKAFEAENRQHTFIEEVQVPSGGSGGVVTIHTKKYQLRLSLEELLTLLDSLNTQATNPKWDRGLVLNARQLRAKILATLGLFEEG